MKNVNSVLKTEDANSVFNLSFEEFANAKITFEEFTKRVVEEVEKNIKEEISAQCSRILRNKGQ